MTRLLGVTFFGLGVICYSAWILEIFLPTELTVTHSLIAEASAEGQPYRELFRAADFATAVSLLIASPFLLRLLPIQLASRLTVSAVAALGVLIALRASFTMDCAPSLSRQCRMLVDDGQVSAAHQFTFVLSLTVTVIYLLGVGSVIRWWPRGFWRTSAGIAFVIVLVSGLALIVLALTDSGRFAGIAERAQALTMAVIVAIGIGYLVGAARSPG